jgi:peptidoglycan/LPS O-acetylase OafA/YrhL
MAVSQPVAASKKIEKLDKMEKRVQGIDILRGLCIIAVVIHHINLRIRFNQSGMGKLIGETANRALFWSGYYGVIVFFVISGFLIATWSLKRWGSLDQISRRQFYWLRFARIVPCLVGLLIVLSVLDRAGVPKFVINTQRTSLGRALLAACTFHINWLESRTGYLPGSWDVLWSLSVEEVFYLFFPLLCIWLRKEFLLITLLLGFVVIGPFARTILTHNQLWADYGYLSCMDGIAFGCLAAIVARKINFSKRGLWILISSGAVLCVVIDVFRGIPNYLGLYRAGLDVTVLEIAVALMAIGLQQRFEQNAPRGHWPTAMLRWFGRNSYEVYLTHMFVVWPVVWAFFRFHQSINAALLWFVAYTALAGVLGAAIARFYSEPMNRWLRAFSTQHSARAAVWAKGILHRGHG